MEIIEAARGIASYACVSDADCEGSASRIGCFYFCYIVAAEGNESFEAEISKASRVCEGYEQFGCEVGPGCDPVFGRCMDGRCSGEQ